MARYRLAQRTDPAPLLAIIVAMGAMFWTSPRELLLWLGTVFVSKGILISLCRQFTKAPRVDAETPVWRAKITAAEFLHGVAQPFLVAQGGRDGLLGGGQRGFGGAPFAEAGHDLGARRIQRAEGVEQGGMGGRVGEAGDGGRGRGGGMAGEGGYGLRIQRAIVDLQFVQLATAQEVVAALDLVRRNHAGGDAELVETGIIDGPGFLAGHRLAVDEQLNATGLVPGEGDMGPRIGLGRLVQLE